METESIYVPKGYLLTGDGTWTASGSWCSRLFALWATSWSLLSTGDAVTEVTSWRCPRIHDANFTLRKLWRGLTKFGRTARFFSHLCKQAHWRTFAWMGMWLNTWNLRSFWGTYSYIGLVNPVQSICRSKDQTCHYRLFLEQRTGMTLVREDSKNKKSLILHTGWGDRQEALDGKEDYVVIVDEVEYGRPTTKLSAADKLEDSATMMRKVSSSPNTMNIGLFSLPELSNLLKFWIPLFWKSQ